MVYVPGYVPVSPSLQSMKTWLCILELCENYINLNDVELVHGAFQVYYILLLFCIFILLIFEFDTETPAKMLHLLNNCPT